MPLNVDLTSSGETATISLAEKFDFDSVEAFRESYHKYKVKEYVVDFRNTEYMDSSGLGMLLNMRRDLADASTEIRLANCKPQIKKLLLISRFETKFSIS